MLSEGYSALTFYRIIFKLAGKQEAIKSRTCANSGQIGLLTWELFVLECRKNTIFDLVRSITFLFLVLIGSL